MKTYIKEFKESCINSNNIKVLCVVVLLTLLATDSWSSAFIAAGVYIAGLLVIWEAIKYYNRK